MGPQRHTPAALPPERDVLSFLQKSDVCLSVCQHGRFMLPLGKFTSNLIFGNFCKMYPEILNLIKI